MSRNRDLAATFGVALVALHSLAATIGYFTKHIPTDLHIPIWTLMVLILIFIPLLRGVARWTALGAVIAGIMVIILLLFELSAFVPASEAFGPVLGLIFAILFTFFSFRAYLEKTVD